MVDLGKRGKINVVYVERLAYFRVVRTRLVDPCFLQALQRLHRFLRSSPSLEYGRLVEHKEDAKDLRLVLYHLNENECEERPQSFTHPHGRPLFACKCLVGRRATDPLRILDGLFIGNIAESTL